MKYLRLFRAPIGENTKESQFLQCQIIASSEVQHFSKDNLVTIPPLSTETWSEIVAKVVGEMPHNEGAVVVIYSETDNNATIASHGSTDLAEVAKKLMEYLRKDKNYSRYYLSEALEKNK